MLHCSNWTNDRDWSYYCTVWDLLPSKNVNPFWPVPFPFYKLPQFTGLSIPAPQVVADPNTYMVAITMNYTSNDNTVIIVREEELPETRILFLNKVMNNLGEPIMGSFSATQSTS